ncbi:seminal metalloprotease 1-like [Anastrepha ludens]|uniref:seminal metalloprotease 1-like n=1 Tax=Anastrepha ludens TaxID=28586 RepID=UPI0023B05047|nr:seminal metalloprotease 1-like [Anastrepha ludens]
MSEKRLLRILTWPLLGFLLSVDFAFGKPVSKLADPEEAAGMFEGDMMLSPGQERMLESGIQGRNGLIDETKRWPNGVVYYKVVGDFDVKHREAILDAIEALEKHTCLKFRVANETSKHYVAIYSKTGGCYTAVGYQAKVQTMNLENYPIGEGCFRPGTILHEFMHALGFYHQQSDSDRDSYITVHYENIVPGKEFNFEKYKGTVVTDFDMGYDYDSCLHYRPGAFSVNGQDTIVPLDLTARIGQREYLSEKDKAKINIMYKCPILI